MDSLTTGMETCYRYFTQTSRAFAAAVQELDGEMRDVICLFYLLIRALDTIEDDMTIPLKIKIPMLKEFHEKCYEPEWKFLESKDRYSMVLENFPVISAEFRTLKQSYRDVMTDVLQNMGEAMSRFIERPVDSLKDWDEYGHSSTGLFVIGISVMSSASGLLDPIVGDDTAVASSVGIYFHKLNAIRDYFDDVTNNRIYWPREVWGKKFAELKNLSNVERRTDALSCLNELILRCALSHLPDLFLYLSRLRGSFSKFWATQSVMGIAQLEMCYNNPEVFERGLKLCRDEVLSLVQEATDVDKVKVIYARYLNLIRERIPHDASYTDSLSSVDKALNCVLCREHMN